MQPPAKAPLTRPYVILLLMVLMALSPAVLGCGDDAVDQPGEATATSVPGGPAAGYQVVAFDSEDGVTLSGRLYGSGTKSVVLLHMYPADQTSWDSVAKRLAAEGYLALTFDFRGYGDSSGDKDIQYLDRDVTAAVQFLRRSGAQEVVLVGASMGGTAGLKAADQLQMLSSIRVAAVATFSAPVEFQGLSAREVVPNLQIQMLFVAAEHDAGADGARELQALSGARGRLELLSGDDHGTDLFAGSQADQAWSLLLDFVRQNMPTAGQ